MEKAIKLLQKVDKSNFMDLYYVGTHPTRDVWTIESILFLEKDDAQELCDYKNRKEKTTIYKVFKNIMHV